MLPLFELDRHPWESDDHPAPMLYQITSARLHHRRGLSQENLPLLPTPLDQIHNINIVETFKEGKSIDRRSCASRLAVRTSLSQHQFRG
jgi:hypothetical protein